MAAYVATFDVTFIGLVTGLGRAGRAPADGRPSSTLTCLYKVSPDVDVVIDRHPVRPDVAIPSPSAHGRISTTEIGRQPFALAVPGMAHMLIAPFSVDHPIALIAARTGRP
jgi:hypothetical protein